jgi:hypothetical protein
MSVTECIAFVLQLGELFVSLCTQVPTCIHMYTLCAYICIHYVCIYICNHNMIHINLEYVCIYMCVCIRIYTYVYKNIVLSIYMYLYIYIVLDPVTSLVILSV